MLLTHAVAWAAAESIPDAEFDDEPDLCVLLASRPGEFSQAAVDRIRRAAPLARIVGLLGAWCEGEARSGHLWPAVPRIYWHRWQEWFQGELATLTAGRCGTLSLPLTTTDEERLLHAGGAARPPRPGRRPKPVSRRGKHARRSMHGPGVRRSDVGRI